ncbi:hypothetical protein ALC56_12137 [Trachymyrmex septentrionalis]|uniref:Uncharacterized protein n=1 Tax=Trachymyrmex septentrionalis TaxID=34720 RepID=A0A195EYQ5_9HYME|nr:hypothetical protein ALC56_12137 [Trachymyrmex septentrionalis]
MNGNRVCLPCHGEMPWVQSAELVNEPWRMAAREYIRFDNNYITEKGLHKMEHHNIEYNTRGIISAFNTRSRKKASKRKKGGGDSDGGGGGDSSGIEMRTTAMVVAARRWWWAAAFPSGSISMYVYLWARVTSYAALPTPLWNGSHSSWHLIERSADLSRVPVHKCIGTTETYEPKVRGRADADTAPKGYSAQCEKVALTGPVRLYTRRPETHTSAALRNTSGGIRARARARVRLFVCSHFNRGWKDVDTCVLVEERRAVPYSRSSLPGELEFLAADRILSRESRDARLATIYATSWASRCAGALYIHNVIHQNVVMRLIVYRRPSESSGMYFPKRNGNANDLFAPLRYIVIDAGHHRIDVTNVGGRSDH